MRLAVILLSGLCAATALAADVTLPVQTQLMDGSGAAIDGTVPITVALYGLPSGGTPVYTESFAPVTVDRGNLALTLGAAGGLSSATLASGQLWAEVTVDGSTLEPRLPVGQVPSAAYASEAAVRHDQQFFTDFSAAAGTAASWTDVGQQMTLPGAGTYLVTYTAETFRSAGSRPDQSAMRLTSPTIVSTIDSDGIVRGIAGTNGVGAQAHGSVAVQVIITIPTAETVTVQVRDQHGGALQLFDGNMTWLRLD